MLSTNKHTLAFVALISIVLPLKIFSSDGLGFGFCDIPENLKETEIYSSLGANYVRIDAKWTHLESENGDWDFSRYDEKIRLAAAEGQQIILILAYSHPRAWTSEDGDARRIRPERVPLYLNYIEAVHKQWGDFVVGYEIWNEPNLHLFWAGTDDEFFHLTKEASMHLRNIADQKLIAVGSIQLNPWIGGMGYMRKFVKSGALDFADAISVHPYGSWIPSQAKWVAKTREFLDHHGYSGKKIWITEVGYPTKSLYPYRVSQKKMPWKIAESLIRLSSAGADIITWFRLFTTIERERTSGAYEAASFALLYREADGVYIPKNGLATWGRIARSLGGLHPQAGVVHADHIMYPIIRAFHYSGEDGHRVLCLWSQSDIQELLLEGSVSAVSALDSITGDTWNLSAGELLQVGSNPIILSYTTEFDANSIHFYEDGKHRIISFGTQ